MMSLVRLGQKRALGWPVIFPDSVTGETVPSLFPSAVKSIHPCRTTIGSEVQFRTRLLRCSASWSNDRRHGSFSPARQIQKFCAVIIRPAAPSSMPKRLCIAVVARNMQAACGIPFASSQQGSPMAWDDEARSFVRNPVSVRRKPIHKRRFYGSLERNDD